MNTYNKVFARGSFAGLAAGVLWGVDSVLIGFILSISPLSEFAFTAPLVATFIHDTFSCTWLLIYMIATKQLREIFKYIKTKGAVFIILGALCGGPIGMTGYVLAISYIGASYTSAISATYPAIGALLAYIFFKDKLKPIGVIGLILAIAATIFLGFSSDSVAINNFALGFICATICAISWGIEAVVSSHGMKNVPFTVALQIRQAISAISYAVVITPLFKAYPIVSVVLHSNVVLLLAVTALAGTLSYFFFYKAISSIGPTRAMALNISYSAWAVILGLLFGSTISLPLFITCIVIIIGSILTLDNPKELLFFKNKNLSNN